jgi:hypothetical protein
MRTALKVTVLAASLVGMMTMGGCWLVAAGAAGAGAGYVAGKEANDGD